ncbi:MAG: prepilin-type N-terminal cleavage/methylation domain-containing protein [Magnetococcales bacterium]|nr:prepilin-type N-terminal cleavage/methylation domain-containing protein [Magnetococcales bacterium]
MNSSLNKKRDGWSQQGVTLVEMAIVMVIAGLLLGSGILLGQSLIQSMYAKELLALVQDLSSGVSHFKEKYHYLPGDLPLAGDDIGGVAKDHCHFPVEGNPSMGGSGVGNGLINNLRLPGKLTSESLCVRDHLSAAGIITGGVGDGVAPVGGQSHIGSRYGAVVLIANSGTGLVENHSHVRLPATILNVIEFSNLPREIAIQIDQALDDGHLTTGAVRADFDPGVEGEKNIAYFAVPL